MRYFEFSICRITFFFALGGEQYVSGPKLNLGFDWVNLYTILQMYFAINIFGLGTTRIGYSWIKDDLR